MYIWEIVQMEQNQFDTQASTSPNAHYMYGLQMQGGNWVESSGIDYRDVQILMRHFNVASPSTLVGHQFESERNSAHSALNLLLTQLRHNGSYKPPAPEEIRELAAQALAEFRIPNFRRIDDTSVAKAFQEVWDGMQADQRWLTEFITRVKQLSEGRVTLEPARIEDFGGNLVKGPANYMKLRSRRQIQLVVIGPYSQPIIFVN